LNVLMISLDTLRADHLSCYGYHRLTSPHIDRLAAGGAVFRTCLAPHIPTHPGHTTVFTGCDVFEHQIVAHGGSIDLDPGVPLLAERFQAAGYFTAAADNLGRWFSRGFARYEGYRWAADPQGRWPKAEAVNRAADQVLAAIAAQDRPFFCFLHYWDVHTPYLPPDPFWGMFYDGDPHHPAHHSLDAMWRLEPFRWYFHEWMPGVTDVEFPKAQYDAELAYLDCCLAHLFTLLHARGLDRDTLVVLFADHGEELDEHHMWFDHHGLYETNVHVPLIFWAPGAVPAKTFFGPVSHYDIAPTLLEAAGLPHDDPRLVGQSLWARLQGGADRPTWDALYLTECSWMRKHAWRTHEWKLILAKEPDFHHCPPVELYHLPSDPGEQRNLAVERPEVVVALQAALEQHVAARVQATGRQAPIDVQAITFHRIGRVPTEVPAPEPPAAVSPSPAPAPPVPSPADAGGSAPLRGRGAEPGAPAERRRPARSSNAPRGEGAGNERGARGRGRPTDTAAGRLPAAPPPAGASPTRGRRGRGAGPA
jgi:arylsulfatase A-like enzyme